MKSKQQKREEALARLQANVARVEATMAKNKNLAKAWVKPVLKQPFRTPQKRFLFAMQPEENPFLSLAKRAERHLEQMETEKCKIISLIAKNRTSYP